MQLQIFIIGYSSLIIFSAVLSVLVKLIALISGLTTLAVFCRDCHFQHSNLCLSLGFSNYVQKQVQKNSFTPVTTSVYDAFLKIQRST